MTTKKKTTDLSSMLGTAKRASDVPRPQVEIKPEVEHKVPEKRVTLSLNAELHRRLKTLASSRGTKVLELTDEAVSSYLDAVQDH
ncbi:CopG family transcriptional regulator [Deinococcus frigens]|uniref:ribbon-helix-helix domain-containing protein n=1 Tax=Deinococcus frigens TaxID=249403 RepID=UPI0004974BC1|nr:CopG family transcriptional regulator [Deinococcus frigens]